MKTAMVAAEKRSESLRRLVAELADLGSVCVALSGGVDSSVVVAAATLALGAERVIAFTASSPTTPADELVSARELAADLGVWHAAVATSELDDPAFVANPRDRCGICKAHVMEAMRAVARESGGQVMVDGANLDDLDDERPGMRAADQLGVVHPLIRAGIDKAGVRALAREMRLPQHDAPQQACLASRIPYGVPITAAKLATIAAGEAVLHELGFRQSRLRHHGDLARIEVEEGEVGRAAGAARGELLARLSELGFTYVTLDLTGFHSGSMNLVAASAGDSDAEEAS